jgi:cytochrome c oxidase assembly protein subunit 15
VALAALALIVFTGAAVRLTGSGLGCPDWPKCYGGVAPPLETHAWIEYGRLLSGLVALELGCDARDDLDQRLHRGGVR